MALTCAIGGACVGDTGPGGGTVFYVASSNFTSTGSVCGTECRYLEAAPPGWITADTPAGQTNCGIPGTSPADPVCEWLGNTSAAIGSTGTGIGTGYANTSAMITRDDTAGKAATVARAFQGGGKTDWLLPSKDELNLLCKYAQGNTTFAVCNGGGTGGFFLTGGGLTSGVYWRSSEHNAVDAWSQSFNIGDQPRFGKSFRLYVRPVRAF